MKWHQRMNARYFLLRWIFVLIFWQNESVTHLRIDKVRQKINLHIIKIFLIFHKGTTTKGISNPLKKWVVKLVGFGSQFFSSPKDCCPRHVHRRQFFRITKPSWFGLRFIKPTRKRNSNPDPSRSYRIITTRSCWRLKQPWHSHHRHFRFASFSTYCIMRNLAAQLSNVISLKSLFDHAQFQP